MQNFECETAMFVAKELYEKSLSFLLVNKIRGVYVCVNERGLWMLKIGL
jgi:hypothetical protein